MSGIAVAQQTYTAESLAFPHSPVKRVSTSLLCLMMLLESGAGGRVSGGGGSIGQLAACA